MRSARPLGKGQFWGLRDGSETCADIIFALLFLIVIFSFLCLTLSSVFFLLAFVSCSFGSFFFFSSIHRNITYTWFLPKGFFYNRDSSIAPIESRWARYLMEYIA